MVQSDKKTKYKVLFIKDKLANDKKELKEVIRTLFLLNSFDNAPFNIEVYDSDNNKITNNKEILDLIKDVVREINEDNNLILNKQKTSKDYLSKLARGEFNK